MAAGNVVPRQGYVVPFPRRAIGGSLGVLMHESRVDEFARLERENL